MRTRPDPPREGACAFRLPNRAPEHAGLQARRKALLAAILLPLSLLAAACHSYHIDTTIENRTGAAIQLLEVDYPDASFGVDTLAPGAEFHYRIQVIGSGQLKISYTGPANKQVQIKGPDLAQRQQGRLQIVLLPDGKAEYHPELTGP